MRFAYIIGGGVLVLLALAKVAGVIHAVWAGSTAPTQFFVKQIVYTVVFFGTAIAMLSAGRGARAQPHAAEASREGPESLVP